MLMCEHVTHICTHGISVHMCSHIQHLSAHVCTCAHAVYMRSRLHTAVSLCICCPLQRLTLPSCSPTFCPLLKLLTQCQDGMCDGLVDGTGTSEDLEGKPFWGGI